MSKLLVTDAIIRARKLGFIAHMNANKTRLWFYTAPTGQEGNKGSWLEVGNIAVESHCLVDLSSFELALK